jgi:hypothetical protein
LKNIRCPEAPRKLLTETGYLLTEETPGLMSLTGLACHGAPRAPSGNKPAANATRRRVFRTTRDPGREATPPVFIAGWIL